MKPEETIDFHIRWLWHRIARIYNNEAAKFNSTMSMGYALLNIDVTNGIASTSLGPKMGMESTSLTRMLTTLEQKGFIKKEQDAHDKRKVILKLTPEGIEMRNKAKEVVLKFNDVVQSKLTKAEMQTLIKVSTKLNDILDQDNIFETP